MRILVILLAGATCLAGLYLSLNRWSEEADLEGGPKPFSFDPALVTGLSLARPEGEISLALREGEWWLERPLKAPADGEAVEEVLAALAGLAPEKAVKDADEAGLGFDRPSLSLVLTLAGGRLAVQVGSAAGPRGGRWLRREGGGTAFLVAGEGMAGLDKDLLTLRDKRLVAPGLGPVREIKAMGPGFGWILARSPGGWRLTGEGVRGPADPLLAEELLTQLREGRIEAFIDRSPADPLASTVRLRGEEGGSWLRLWPPGEGQRTAVGRSSRHLEPFLVDAALHEAFTRAPSGLLDRRLMGYDPLSAGRLEMVRLDAGPPLRLVVERSPGGPWRVSEPDQGRPGSPKVDQALAAALVDSLAQVRYLERTDRGLSRAVVRLTVFDLQGRVLAGLELGRDGSGELLGRKLDEDPVYRLGDGLGRELPWPWALDKGN